MALIKTTQTNFGIEASYWKITMVSIDRHMKEGSFSLSLYMTKGANQFLQTETVSLMQMEDKTAFAECFESNGYNVYKSCYDYAKNHVDFFLDAVDDADEVNNTETV